MPSASGRCGGVEHYIDEIVSMAADVQPFNIGNTVSGGSVFLVSALSGADAWLSGCRRQRTVVRMHARDGVQVGDKCRVALLQLVCGVERSFVVLL
jgi:hypothetical protein